MRKAGHIAKGHRAVCFPLLLTALGACSGSSHPPTLSDSDAGGTVTVGHVGCISDATATAPPGPDADGLCGNLFLNTAGTPPNIYFLLDRSGSMQASVDGRQKYAAVSDSAVKLVRSLGARANVGAAVFPSALGNEPCSAGEEVFPTTAGDPIQTGSCPGDGPVTLAFSRSISLPGRVSPHGSTPTAATLTALTPLLTALPGKTALILSTDGGPNCNPSAACGAASCIPNIEGDCPATIGNCCDHASYGPVACLDGEPTRAAVAELRRRGIKTYVVGVPGSAPYSALLTQLAQAGGTERAGEPAYYEAEHVAELDSLLSTIGDSVTVSCDQFLSAPPPNAALVNVYLDRRQLSYASRDGWLWVNAADADGSVPASAPDAAGDSEETSPSDAGPSLSDATSTNDATSRFRHFRLTGQACTDLESGRVRQLQVTFGCPTAIIN